MTKLYNSEFYKSSSPEKLVLEVNSIRKNISSPNSVFFLNKCDKFAKYRMKNRLTLDDFIKAQDVEGDHELTPEDIIRIFIKVLKDESESDKINRSEKKAAIEENKILKCIFPWIGTEKARINFVFFWLLVLIVGFILILVLVVQPEKLLTIVIIAGITSFSLAFANGANDIANSMGTSFGAGALSMKNCLKLGILFEVFGAVSMGQFVAKTISKGVIEPSN